MDFFQLTDIEIQALLLSLKVGVVSTLVSLPFALYIGYVMARKQFWGKSIIESFLHLPLVMPPVTTGYLLLLLLGSKGMLGSWIYSVFGFKIAFSYAAVVIAAMVVAFPLVVRSIRTAIEMVDEGLEQASWTLGKGKISTFFNVVAPLAMPGIISGVILGFARSLGEFGATITFAGNIAGETQTLPLAIYTNMQVPGQEDATFRIVLISIFIAFVAMVVSEWYIKKMKDDRN